MVWGQHQLQEIKNIKQQYLHYTDSATYTKRENSMLFSTTLFTKIQGKCLCSYIYYETKIQQETNGKEEQKRQQQKNGGFESK